MARIRIDGGQVVCERGELAVNMWTRTKGLLGRSHLEPDQGLWIQPTNSIHMFFMRFAIDVVFTDINGKVLKVVHDLGPWRISFCSGAKVALELPVGAVQRSGVKPGDYLVIER